MALQCRAARPADLPETCALLHRVGAYPDAGSPREVELRLWSVWKQTGWSPLNQVVVEEGGALVATVLFVPCGERGVVIEPARVLSGTSAAEALRGALGVLAKRYAYAQAFLEAEDRDFAAAGMRVASRLLSLERPAGPRDAEIRPEVGLGFRAAGEAELEAVVTRTLEGSRDAEALRGSVPASEVLASLRPPDRWYLAEVGGSPVGCLLLSGAGQPEGVLSLQYMGVVPEERGRHLGRALVRRAIEEAAAGGFSRIKVSVDEANGAARAIYAAHGFAVTGRKVLHFARLGG